MDDVYFRFMKVYLDSCSLQRPLDDKEQIRIAVEAEAIISVLALVEEGSIDLMTSEPLVYEARQTSDLMRKEHIFETLGSANIFIHLNKKIKSQSRKFIKKGIKPLDALHLASALYGKADFFCTCDDKFFKKAVKLNLAPMKSVSPVELIEELDK